ncbi:hypothetical protein J6590_079515 [Homalodisca vitripennis]|nr:hypothetical protein J6590_079515 [Homalodisca vitripennis]
MVSLGQHHDTWSLLRCTVTEKGARIRVSRIFLQHKNTAIKWCDSHQNTHSKRYENARPQKYTP